MTPHALGRAGRLALAVVPIWFTGSFAATPTVAPALRVLVVATGVLTLVRPVEGLLAVSVLCALGDLIAMAFDTVTVRVSEALVVAFLSGWLLTATGDRERGPSPIVATRYAAWALAAVIVASLAVNSVQAPAELSSFWLQAGRRLWHEYLNAAGDPIGAIAAARLLEGIGLAAAVVILFRFKPMLAVWIPEALGAGAVVAAVAAVLLWRGIAFPQIMARYRLIGYRVVAHVADLNAAGSYFSLILFIAAGLAGRERGRKCAVGIGIASSALGGLWLSG